MEQFSNEPVYTISTAARKLRISIHTLRMYENEGLILPYKKKSKQRLYSDHDLERIRCIRKSINEDRIGIEGIRRMLALIPCWGIKECSIEDKNNCLAFSGYAKPCWMINHKNNCCVDQDCRECEVYNKFGSCKSIKDVLKELINPENSIAKK